MAETVQRERAWVLAFAAFAVFRVLASSALFPFFNNVDEPAHFDLVVKYSRGEPPARLEAYSRESALAIALHVTPEYLTRPERFGGRFPEPLATRSGAAAAVQLFEQTEAWSRDTNTESAEPPLYYALAGLWLELGRIAGLEGVTLLFWIRALNALPAAGLVWLGHATARAVFPDSALQRLGVPLLLAVSPQDAFYSIGGDMLSPLCFGAAFLGLVRFNAPGVPAPLAAAGTGLALAAAVLAKTANLPLIGVAGVALLLGARGAGRARPVAIALACAALPIAIWLAWNRARFGDWTGAALKIARLDWTMKSLGDWLPHPLFSPAGLAAFWPELLASFWRGEFVWHGERLALRGMDFFYWSSSAILPAVALLRLPASRDTRRALLLAAASFASAVLFLATLSLAFDFGRCFYPSRAQPFFTSGRLLSGALVPFLLLYVYGLDRAFAWSGSPRARWLALAAIAVAVTASELWLDQAPLSSAYNAIHLGD